jgi:hypothetical protein
MPKIAGFTITGGTGYYKTYGGGIYANGAIPVIEYNHIEDCSITGTQPSGAGIRVGQGIWDTNKVCLIRYNIIKNCSINAVSNTMVGTAAGISLGPISVIVEGNTITNNSIALNATSNAYGGGIECDAGNAFYHSIIAIIKNNLIMNNSAKGNLAEGGGIAYYDANGWAHLIVEGNTISGNEAVTLSESGQALGGGIMLENMADGSKISNNTISNNIALEGTSGSIGYGGGMHLNFYISPGVDDLLLIEKNRITGNTAQRGGGINIQNTPVEIVNNFISGNQAEVYAGGIFLGGNYNTPECTFVNNTFTENSVPGQGINAGSMLIIGAPEVLLMNNIFYGNLAPEANELDISNSTVRIHYCDINPDDIKGAWTGENNFFTNPEFIDNQGHIDQYSPCEDQGADSINIDGTWYYAPLIDFEGTLRPWHMGIDMGADEVDIIDKLPILGTPINWIPVQCYPNPFSNFIIMEYELEQPSKVNLTVYNHLGQQIAVLVDGEQVAGNHMVQWEAEGLSTGIYFYRLTTSNESYTGNLVVVR